MGAALVPANLPFYFYLKRLAASGGGEGLAEFYVSRNLSDLPLSLWGRFFYTFLPFIILLGVLLIVWRVLHGKGLPALLTGSERFRWPLLARAGLCWLLLSALADLAQFFLRRESYRFNPDFSSWPQLLLLGLIFIVPQIMVEETFFRGYLIKGGTLLTGNPVFPLVLFSLLFGLLHSANPEVARYGFLLMMPQYMGMGLFLSFLSWKTDGLEMSLGIHLANNSWGLLIVNSGGTAFDTPSPFRLTEWNPLFSLIALAAGMAVFLLMNRASLFFLVKKEKGYYYNN